MTDDERRVAYSDLTEHSSEFARAVAPILSQLIGLLDAVSMVADTHDLHPCPSSVAAIELASQHELAAAWSETPVADALSQMWLLLTAAEGHVRAFDQNVFGHRTSPPTLELLARGTIENFARLLWLAEPEIGRNERVKRAVTERIYSLDQQSKLGPEARNWAEPIIERVVAGGESLGFERVLNRKGKLIEPAAFALRQSATKLIGELMLDDDADGLGYFVHALFSSATHGTLFGLARHVSRVEGLKSAHPDVAAVVVSSREVEMGVRAMILAALNCLERWTLYMGWNTDHVWRRSVLNSLARLDAARR